MPVLNSPPAAPGPEHRKRQPARRCGHRPAEQREHRPPGGAQRPSGEDTEAGGLRRGRWPGRLVSREPAVFLAIGAAGLVVQPALYWLLRGWWPIAAANFVSLLVVMVLNTEANRRLTFRGSPARPVRAHLVAGLLLAGGYLVNEAATTGWQRLNPGCTRLSEALVEAVASCLFTAVRFVVLRRVVFRPAAP